MGFICGNDMLRKVKRFVCMATVVSLCLLFQMSRRTFLEKNYLTAHSDTSRLMSSVIEVYSSNWSTETIHSSRRRVHEVDCKNIFEGDANEIKKANAMEGLRGYGYAHSSIVSNSSVKNCQTLNFLGNFEDFPIGQEERSFPLAFSILFHTDIYQVIRLFRAIYRRHNKYCLHVDRSASKDVQRIAELLANCFSNVFMVSKNVDVIYATFSRLEAEINCMKDSLYEGSDWKYFINLPGSEYPLKTNAEIVKILKIYNGSNDIEGITNPSRMLQGRYKYKHVMLQGKLHKTNQTYHKPPHNLNIVKGSAYGVFSRSFIEFVIKDQRVKDFLSWCQYIYSPDEYFWATLNHDKTLKAPGGYHDVPDKKSWLAAFAVWGGDDECHGKFVRSVCVFGPGDLNLLATRKELFANKFHMRLNPITYRCMEEWILNKTYSPHLPFDTYFYRNLRFIQH